MTSVRKRKMKRSSVSRNTRRLKDKQRKVEIRSNPLIASKWDHSLTIQQNYKKLGLRAKLGNISGGIEKKPETLTEIREKLKTRPNVSEVESTSDPDKIPEGEARLIRDPETNEVKEIIYGRMKIEHSENTEDRDNEVIRELEEQGRKYASIKLERKPSERENEWLKNLYEKYGDDYEKMKWDKKLNVFQQSAGDLRKRITKWKRINNIK